MSFYSISCVTDDDLAIETPIILLGKGYNVFTATTDDLDGLLKQLTAKGARNLKVKTLTDHTPVTLTDELLAGETLENFSLSLRMPEEGAFEAEIEMGPPLRFPGFHPDDFDPDSND